MAKAPADGIRVDADGRRYVVQKGDVMPANSTFEEREVKPPIDSTGRRYGYSRTSTKAGEVRARNAAKRNAPDDDTDATGPTENTDATGPDGTTDATGDTAGADQVGTPDDIAGEGSADAAGLEGDTADATGDSTPDAGTVPDAATSAPAEPVEPSGQPLDVPGATTGASTKRTSRKK